MENEEKNTVNVEEKSGFKDILLKNLDYVIVYTTLFILYIVVLVTGLDKMYRYLIFGIISLLFGSYELKKVISSREKKSLIDIILSITWLLSSNIGATLIASCKSNPFASNAHIAFVFTVSS